MNEPVDSFSVLTSKARGAVAVIRIVGAGLSSKLASAFSPKNEKAFQRFESGTLIYGDWSSNLDATEDIVICPIDPFTAEIHGHGGLAAVEAICDSLVNSGFRHATADKMPALMKLTPWALALTEAMALAETPRSATILLDQFHRCDRIIADWTKSLSSGGAQKTADEIAQSLRWEKFGRRLLEPWTVVLSGKPNVGKSSLINALVGFERAIVHETPGTTRDVVTQQSAIDGWLIEFKDTAGIRASHDSIERQGIEFAQREIETADLVIRVVDVDSPLDTPLEAPEGHDAFADFENELATETRKKLDCEKTYANRKPDLLVVNKIDLWHLDEVERASAESANINARRQNRLQRLRDYCLSHQMGFVETSVVTSVGIEELMSLISHRLVPELPPVGMLIPFNDVTVQMLQTMGDQA